MFTQKIDSEKLRNKVSTILAFTGTKVLSMEVDNSNLSESILAFRIVSGKNVYEYESLLSAIEAYNTL